MRFKDHYPRIASISVEDWVRIHQFCRGHDVESGIDREILYDARREGAIHVWSRENWRVPNGRMFCTYYPDRSDQIHSGEIIEDVMYGRMDPDVSAIPGDVGGAQWVDIYFATGMWDEFGIDYVIENYEKILRYSKERNWTPEMGREYFIQLYEEVTGKQYKRMTDAEQRVEEI